MIHIDGSRGEGGGQILRTALTFSALTGHPIHLHRIRANRRKPGLAPQHLAGVKAAAQICQAEMKGVKLESQEIWFEPASPVQAGEYYFDISTLAGTGSAGAVTLLLQAVMLPLMLADGSSHLTLRGGTHVNWSPPVHYTQSVLLPTLSLMGADATLHLETWGWYPKGGGQVTVTINGQSELTGVDLTERGDLINLSGVGAASNLPAHIPERISNRANNVLKKARMPAGVKPVLNKGSSTGAMAFIAVEYEHAHAGFTSLGKRGKPSEEVANEVTHDVLQYLQQPHALDPYLPDQILPAMAVATGESALSTMTITSHTQTNLDVIAMFIEREIEVDGERDGPGIIRIKGLTGQYLSPD